MLGPQRFVDFLQHYLYHPRSDAHSNQICRLIVEDLLAHCPPIAHKASCGELVACLNLKQRVGHSSWKIDLALGRPAGTPVPPSGGEVIRFERPAIIQIALEAKGVMTEHRKARFNRLRDLEAFHEHAHRYSGNVIAVGVVVVNASDLYWSPTRAEDDITVHKNITELAEKTVDTYRSLPLRTNPSDGPGFEAVSVLVVKHDNFRKNPNLPSGYKPKKSVLVSGGPAPSVGDPLNYSSMIYRICDAYQSRFG